NINSFDLAKQAVSDELTRVWRQTGGSESDIAGWKASINAAKGPKALASAWKTIGGLLESKLQSMQDQYQQGMGTTPVNVITPGARQSLDKLEGSAPGGKVRVQGRDGKTYEFPSQAAADQFKKAGG